MFDGEVYADFGLLWLLSHYTRVEAGDDGKPESCWLEKWSQAAHEQGTRVLEDLRGGVEKAIEALGRGFVSHPRNDVLRERLRKGELATQDFYRQVLRQVYRLLFLFVAEDRELLHPPVDDALSSADRERTEAARVAYDAYYSTRRLRELALSIRGSRHGDLWYALSLVYRALIGDAEGAAARAALALPELGSFLWDAASTPDLSGPAMGDGGCHLANQDLLEAVRHLAFVEQNRTLRVVDYKNLGSEELGSVYESLLELHPEINAQARHFALRVAAGSERKTTGSYYTPDSLVQCLLDSALEPVVADRLEGLKTAAEREAAILDLKVCDPAVGSGHFLIAAAHRIARHLARVRAADADLPDDANRSEFPPLVTTGLIDLATCTWGTQATRILKQKWQAPRVDRQRMYAEGTLGQWIDRRRVPKAILATQTKVIEVFVDEPGEYIASIPLITVMPNDVDRLWHIAAALASPVTCAIAMRQFAGAALSAEAIKISAKQTLALPIPEPSDAWDEAATLLRQAQGVSDVEHRSDLLLRYAQASVAAFRVQAEQAEAVVKWWAERLGGASSSEEAPDGD